MSLLPSESVSICSSMSSAPSSSETPIPGLADKAVDLDRSLRADKCYFDPGERDAVLPDPMVYVLPDPVCP